MTVYFCVPDSKDSQPEAAPVILRMARVKTMTGLGRSTIYRLMSMQLFPSAVRLGPRAVGWRLSEITEWNAARPAVIHRKSAAVNADETSVKRLDAPPH